MKKQVEYLSTDQVKPYGQNARTHDNHQISQIARSIEQFGFINPVVVDKNYEIIAGHGRYQAALMLGLKKIPALRADHLTESEIRAYRLADNKIAENAGWDNNLLRVELSYLIDCEFDLDSIGFSTAEVDVIVSDESPDDIDDPLPRLRHRIKSFRSLAIYSFVVSTASAWVIARTIYLYHR